MKFWIAALVITLCSGNGFLAFILTAVFLASVFE
jgi:hypothetical protein